MAQHSDKIPGGIADKKKPSDFDPKALAKGQKVEMEHTDDPAQAREIAMDHLTEDPAYYDKLETIEKHGSRFPVYTKKAKIDLKIEGLDGLVRGEPTTLYHGTTASFRKFDLSKSRDELVNQFYGKGIFLTPSRRVAWKYASANRNMGFPPSIIQKVRRKNADAGDFLALLVKHGDDAWEMERSPGVSWAASFDEIDVDLNTVRDVAAYVIGSKIKPMPTDNTNIFSMSTGMPDWVYDDLDDLGVDSSLYRPKVYTVTVQVDNVLVTARKASARAARRKGYDAVVFHGQGLVDGVPEVAVFDPNKVRIKKMTVESSAVTASRLAKKFELNKGDPVLMGKYKNSPGRIEGFGDNGKGDPTVKIRKRPKNEGGKGSVKEVGLFKIRYDAEQAKKDKKARFPSKLDHEALYRHVLDVTDLGRGPAIKQWKSLSLGGTRYELLWPDPDGPRQVRFKKNGPQYQWSHKLKKWRKARRPLIESAREWKTLTQEDRDFYRLPETEMLSRIEEVPPSMLRYMVLFREMLPPRIVRVLEGKGYVFKSPRELGYKIAMEHPTDEARKKYLKKHPNADPKNHTVKGEGEKTKGEKTKGKKPRALPKKSLRAKAKKAIKGVGSKILSAVKDEVGEWKAVKNGIGKLLKREKLEPEERRQVVNYAVHQGMMLGLKGAIFAAVPPPPGLVVKQAVSTAAFRLIDKALGQRFARKASAEEDFQRIVEEGLEQAVEEVLGQYEDSKAVSAVDRLAERLIRAEMHTVIIDAGAADITKRVPKDSLSYLFNRQFADAVEASGEDETVVPLNLLTKRARLDPLYHWGLHEGESKLLDYSKYRRVASTREGRAASPAESVAQGLVRSGIPLDKLIRKVERAKQLWDAESRQNVPAAEVLAVLRSWVPKPMPSGGRKVYHATSPQNAKRLLAQGFVPEAKPRRLTDTYAPGRGLDAGLYVGKTPRAVESYGRVVLEVQVPRGSLRVPTELSQLGVTNPDEALRQHDGAVVFARLPKESFKVIGGLRYMGRNASQMWFHGTTVEAAKAILKSGFDVARSGARQKALHGRDVAEARGIYLTSDRSRAEWYAGGLSTPGGGGGAVVEVQVRGRILPERDFWRLKRVVSDEMGLALYDPRAQDAADEANRRIQSLGFVGFEENADEIVVFDARSLKVVGAVYASGYDRGRPLQAGAGAALRVASKYQKKKQVPKADGKGTTTVYEYTDGQVRHRNREKAKKVEKLRQNLGKLRSQVKKDLSAGDDKTRLCALAVGLMNDTYERVGNETSAKDGHFGVTGWQAQHISFSGGKATISYVGKSGVKQKKTVSDAGLIKGLKKALEGKSGSDAVFDITASDVNEYLKPHGITAKDIRGLHANREVQTRLKAIRSKGGKLPDDKKEREKKLKDEFKKALEEAAAEVGHEASTLRSQYLVPGLEDAYLADGSVKTKLDKQAGMGREAIIHVQNAWPDPLGSGGIEGLEGLLSSLTVTEAALINDLDRAGGEKIVAGSEGWEWRGYSVADDVVAELQGAGYLGAEQDGEVGLSDMFLGKRHLYARWDHTMDQGVWEQSTAPTMDMPRHRSPRRPVKHIPGLSVVPEQRHRRPQPRKWQRPQKGYWLQVLRPDGSEKSRMWLTDYKEVEVEGPELSKQPGVARVVLRDNRDLPMRSFTRGRLVRGMIDYAPEVIRSLTARSALPGLPGWTETEIKGRKVYVSPSEWTRVYDDSGVEFEIHLKQANGRWKPYISFDDPSEAFDEALKMERGQAVRAEEAWKSQGKFTGKLKFKSRITGTTVDVVVTRGSKTVGKLQALRTRRIRWCAEDIESLKEAVPQMARVNDTVMVTWSELDPDLRGQHVGSAMYHAMTAVVFKKIGPFFLAAHDCGSSTNDKAMWVWKSLGRIYPRSGNVVAVTKAPKWNKSLKVAVDEGLRAIVRATKTDGEKEEEEVERLQRPNPKKKPPRKDLRRNRMKPEDEDIVGGVEGDRDLSMNYKVVGSLASRVMRALTANEPRKPGDVWQSDKGNWVGKNPKGEIQAFGKDDKAKEQAEAYAKGSGGGGDAEADAEQKKKDRRERAKQERQQFREDAKEILNSIELPRKVRTKIENQIFYEDKMFQAFRAAEKAAIEQNVTSAVMKGARKDPFKNVDTEDPEQLAEALVDAMVRDRILLNPAAVGGKPLSSSPLDEEERVSRAEASMKQFRYVTPEQRQEVAQKAVAKLTELDPDSPEADELNAIIDGLHMAFVLNDEPFDVQGREGLLREPLSPKLKTVAKEMARQGSASFLFLKDPTKLYQREGREAVRDALGRLDDATFIEMSQGSPWEPLAEVLDSFDLDPDVAEYVRATMRDMAVTQMTTTQGVAASLARKKKDADSPGAIYDEIAKALNDSVQESTKSTLDSLVSDCLSADDIVQCFLDKQDDLVRAQMQGVVDYLDGLPKGEQPDPQEVTVALSRAVVNGSPPSILNEDWEVEEPLEKRRQKFLRNVKDPKERERVRKMSPEQFAAMEKTVLEDEEDGEKPV